jgi:hypothetical protein
LSSLQLFQLKATQATQTFRHPLPCVTLSLRRPLSHLAAHLKVPIPAFRHSVATLRRHLVIDVIRSHRMPAAPIDLKSRQLKDDYKQLVRRRRALERFAPIDSRPLTEIDKLLEKHPLLKPKMELAIRSRAIYMLWLAYADAVALLKHEILLSLRECYRALSTHDQEELWQLWWRWLDHFEEEEVANGTRTTRRYVWSPYASLGGCDA